MTRPAVAQKRRGRARSKTAACARIDVRCLATTLFEVEQSLYVQGLELSPEQRAELVAEAYAAAVEAGEPPQPRDIDRMVWMTAR